jgi:hypothetical protein
MGVEIVGVETDHEGLIPQALNNVLSQWPMTHPNSPLPKVPLSNLFFTCHTTSSHLTFFVRLSIPFQQVKILPAPHYPMNERNKFIPLHKNTILLLLKTIRIGLCNLNTLCPLLPHL